jgi:hypothetical protein
MTHGAGELLSEARQCCSSARCQVLEALWRALSDSGNMRIGYNPAVADACEALRRMDREAGRSRVIHSDKSGDLQV